MSILNRDTALLPSDVFVVSDKLPPELYEKYRYYRTLSLAMADATAGIHVLCYNTPTSYTSVTGVTVSFIKPGLSELRYMVGLFQSGASGAISQWGVIKNDLGLLLRTTPSITQDDPIGNQALYTYALGSAAVARLSGWICVPNLCGSSSSSSETYQSISFGITPNITASGLYFRTSNALTGEVAGFGGTDYTSATGAMFLVEFKFIKIDGFTWS